MPLPRAEGGMMNQERPAPGVEVIDIEALEAEGFFDRLANLAEDLPLPKGIRHPNGLGNPRTGKLYRPNWNKSPERKRKSVKRPFVDDTEHAESGASDALGAQALALSGDDIPWRFDPVFDGWNSAGGSAGAMKQNRSAQEDGSVVPNLADASQPLGAGDDGVFPFPVEQQRNLGQPSDGVGTSPEKKHREVRVLSFPPPRPEPNPSSYPHISEIPRPLPPGYGEPDDVPVGMWWDTRMEVAWAGVHRPVVCGIKSGPVGAQSICMSCGYDQNDDHGDYFWFCGQGGRDLRGTEEAPKNARVGEQTKDMEWRAGNLALRKSVETGFPVRVSRGYAKKKHVISPYAPPMGYRYDGLYKVIQYEEIRDVRQLRVIRFLFVRYRGQEEIQI